ncbi:serine hydrolase [Aureimonas fodinaquatilis]|uniref:Serine hydrolase n=2 Tax=Aureimonas fodinaquatilis TaxID=2565783 RepID=A0A5B0DTS2_9HYPH|nr:serine hydrolase [Aureimonas fodinaquatilis]
MAAPAGAQADAALEIKRPVARDQVLSAAQQLEELALKSVGSGPSQMPGLAIAVVHEGEVVFLKGFGLREEGKPDTVDADTVFQLASLSKPVSSTVVAALVGEGALEWDTPVSHINPGFQLQGAYPSQQVTPRDLFSHRSGLPGDAGNELEALGFDRQDILSKLRQVPPASSFRAGYSYSNFGLTAGAVAAADAAGLSWEDATRQKLFQPLGMAATSSRHSDFVAQTNRSALHMLDDGHWAALLVRDADAQAPAGGISSTVRDLAEWMKLELSGGIYNGNRLIPADALSATHQPLMTRGNNPVTGASSFYGLGWNVEFERYGLSWGHAGAFSVGARTLVTLYPHSGLGIVVLGNSFPSGVPEALAASFFDLAFEGRVTRNWAEPWNAAYAGLFGPAIAEAEQTYAKPETVKPALDLDAYAGRYANDYFGEAEIAVSDEKLVLTMGPDAHSRFDLTHFDRDIFLYHPAPEMPEMPVAVSFTIGADGRGATVTMDDLNSSGLGTLTRKP